MGEPLLIIQSMPGLERNGSRRQAAELELRGGEAWVTKRAALVLELHEG